MGDVRTRGHTIRSRRDDVVTSLNDDVMTSLNDESLHRERMTLKDDVVKG